MVEKVKDTEGFQLKCFPFTDRRRIGCCKHGCNNDRGKPGLKADDGWRICPVEGCDQGFFCPNKQCQAFGNKHAEHHLEQKTKDAHYLKTLERKLSSLSLANSNRK